MTKEYPDILVGRVVSNKLPEGNVEFKNPKIVFNCCEVRFGLIVFSVPVCTRLGLVLHRNYRKADRERPEAVADYRSSLLIPAENSISRIKKCKNSGIVAKSSAAEVGGCKSRKDITRLADDRAENLIVIHTETTANDC